MKNRPEYIVVGRFGRPRGVSGEIYLNALTDNPERFSKPGTFWMEAEDGWTEIKIVSVRFISGRLAVRVESIAGHLTAKRLTNSYLYIKGSELKEAPEGSYYHFDLEDCQVLDIDGRKLGKLVKVEKYPANDVWVIENDKSKEYLFPAVSEYIKEVDIDRKIITLDPPEGIFGSEDES